MRFIATSGRRAAALIASLGLCSLAQMAGAQSTDGKALRLVVPNQAGSQVDAVARAMSSQLGAAYGRPVVIENLPGSGGMTGTLQIVNAPKDGTTLGMVSSNHAINPFIYKKVPFDSVKDITPITVIGAVPVVLVVNPSQVKAKTTKEFIAELKARPKDFSYGSAGNGTVLHLAAEYFTSEAGVDILHVPYKGTGAMLTDIIGGQVQFGMLPVPTAAPHIKAGKLRALGISTAARSPALPDVPTLAESGLPGFDFEAWVAIIGPAGMPAPVVADAYKKIKTALDQKDVHDALVAQGMNVTGMTPEQFAPYLKAELDKHGKLVKKSGATAD
jgi:tripartite-type tricarboxylate transporter receptor subunit TctC